MSTRQTQENIKKAAVDLFNELGTINTSTNHIAERCGISIGNLYYHFKNKEEIIQAVYDDISREINDNWKGDERKPTILHMAEMFSRALEEKWRYRFFYREINSLTHNDPALKQHVIQSRKERMENIIVFFEELIKQKILKKPKSKESLRYIVLMTWIFSENWLNFVTLEGAEVDAEKAQEGYDFIIEILYPYLTRKARKEIFDSYSAIQSPNSPENL